jgi:Ni,Fe-hydrogenase III large subunit
VTRLETLGLRNRRTVPFASVPCETLQGFRDTLLAAVREHWRVAAYFGMREAGGSTRIVAVLAQDELGMLGATTTSVTGRYPSLTPECPELHYFERELAEQCGVVPEGHPALKPVRRHPPDHAAVTMAAGTFDREAFPFSRIEGDEVHEIAVGPVHAGIIEPGHFRFQAHGEEILGLEIMLGYQHRGVERLLETAGRDRAMLVAESIAGDSVIAHGGVHCSVIEALGRARKTPRAQAIRGIALELERLANHVGDLGAIAGDIAYQPAAVYCGRMRGDFLNLLLSLSGNRHGRGLARPGGVLFDIDPGMAASMREQLERLRDELHPVIGMLLENASVQVRLEGVGVLTRAQVQALGVVGPPARACDVPRDVRHDHPYGLFRFAHIPVATAWAGDVLSRALVRWVEVQRSLDFVLEQLAGLPRGAIRVECGALHPGELVVSMAEGWRGEVVHVAITDDAGGLRRYKVVDPSFHNWSALAAVMPGNQVSDFPLCNKSFNLSYAGHDL